MNTTYTHTELVPEGYRHHFTDGTRTTWVQSKDLAPDSLSYWAAEADLEDQRLCKHEGEKVWFDNLAASPLYTEQAVLQHGTLSTYGTMYGVYAYAQQVADAVERAVFDACWGQGTYDHHEAAMEAYDLYGADA